MVNRAGYQPPRVPTERDWGDTAGDLEVASAHEQFAGRSREEATRCFGVGSIIERIDELRWMPPAPFRYYVLALCDYVQSQVAVEERHDPASAASGFLNLIEQKLADAPQVMAPVVADVMAAAEYVAKHQKRFRARTSNYGSFGAQLRRIRTLAKKAGGWRG